MINSSALPSCFYTFNAPPISTLWIDRSKRTYQMKDLLDKLSSYNLFNYLLPGVIFATLLERFTSIHVIQDGIVPGVFVYYFIGSIISRIGSLYIEPLLKRTKFVVFSPYSDFIAAAKNDPKIEILSEQNNMYRTFCSMLLLFSAVLIFDKFGKGYPWLNEWGGYLVLTALFSLYLFSYRKQSNYITDRVNLRKAN